jgi:3'-phosphoadenosine 5'-phosphosulfate sulfotransferase (PAPS reductase)/FAD synthetase
MPVVSNHFAHILSFSGGKDSTALYLLAMETGRPFIPVFADVGNEHPAVYDFVKHLPEKTGGPLIQWVKADFTADFERKRAFIARKWPLDGVPAAKIDRALALLHPTGIPFIDLCMLKGRFPSIKTRFCTEELKLVPMFEQVSAPLARTGRVIVSWQGVRAEESFARSLLSKRQRINLAPYSARKSVRDEADDWRAYAFRPLINWTVEEVFAFHKRHGVEPNPLYAQGMTRVGCMPCVNVKKSELREIAARFPEHIDRVAEWERVVSETSKRGAATFFGACDDPNYIEGETVTPKTRGIHSRVEWSRTSRGGKQLDFGLRADMNTECNAWGTCE